MTNDGHGQAAGHEATFPADTIPRHYHLDLWRRVCSNQCNVVPLDSDWCFRGRVSAWHIDDLLITHQCMSATRYERTAAQVARSEKDWLVLRYAIAGSHTLLIDDRVHIRNDPETIVVQDWCLPYVDVSSEYELITIGIPRQLVAAAEHMGRATPAVAWAADSPQGELLRAAIDKLLLNHAAPGEDAAALCAGFIGLVDGLLGTEAALLRNRYAETESSRIDAMKRHIREHLRDPGLGVQTLCDSFHCSRATVYRLFSDEGGVASYIQRQRLHSCMRELTRIQKPPKGVLEQIASAWGFTNPHRFSRLFKAQFDLSPQQALRAQAPAVKHENSNSADYWASATRLRDWLDHRPGEPKGQP